MPGTSGNVTVAVRPAVSEGFSTRSYRVHPPASYDGTRPLAVVLDFHGYGGTAAGQDGPAGFSALAEREDFLAVYPQGLPDGPGGAPFWASVGTIDHGIDDIAYTNTVLDSLERAFCVDPRRIYVTGFSNGGGMVGFLACRLANRIAAFAPVSGNFYEPPDGCDPARPVPILDFHGSADTVLPYDGLPARENPEWPLPPILGWLAQWAARDGCAPGPETFLNEPSVEGLRWTGCRSGTAVVHYRIVGGGHAWPPAIDGQPANEVIWRFFQTYTLPA